MNLSASPIFNKVLYILIGLVIGVVICLTFVLIKDSTKKDSGSNQKALLKLELAQPEKFIATGEKVYKIAGDTQIASVITINSPTKNVTLKSSDGKFSSEVELVEGKNVIDITAFDPDSGESQTDRKEILYLSEELNDL